MAIDPAKLERFKMKQTAEQANMKSHIDEIITADKWEFTEYVDIDGVYHNVLAVSVNGTKDIYRTEVKAFIEKFKQYIDIFGDEPAENRPKIRITGQTSKKKNPYISFDLVDDDGNKLD